MKITRYKLIPKNKLLSSIKRTKLKGFDQPSLYKNSILTIEENVDPSSLVPAQRYVLEEDFKRIEELYNEFNNRHSIDIFSLDGGILFWIEDEKGNEEGPIPLTPPIVEFSNEPDNKKVRLINDGMHRVYAARRLGKPINIVQIDNVPKEFPYYAYALPNGWDDVSELMILPDGFEKKTYRVPDNYKSLFRDFNGIFPGIQKKRKNTNPKHLKA